MFKRILIAVLALIALQFAFCHTSSAQGVGNCHVTTIVQSYPDAILPGYFLIAGYWGPTFYLVGKYSCDPAASPGETCPFCPSASSPISLATGDTYIQQNDVSLPGLSNGLRLDRTWNSVWPTTQLSSQTGIFGPNWRSTFEERIFSGSDGSMKYSRSDGSFWSFQQGVSPANLVAPANIAATLSSGTSYWTVAFQNGEQRLFDNASGSLVAIIDRNGNQTSLSYDGTHRLSTVTDPVSRHLYFNYANSSFPNLVTSVTSDVSLTLSYSYDTQGRLTQVTRPDLSTINFTYNSQSLITSVTDAQGKVIESHTYDSAGRGLTASQANGVNAVTVTYP